MIDEETASPHQRGSEGTVEKGQKGRIALERRRERAWVSSRREKCRGLAEAACHKSAWASGLCWSPRPRHANQMGAGSARATLIERLLKLSCDTHKLLLALLVWFQRSTPDLRALGYVSGCVGIE